MKKNLNVNSKEFKDLVHNIVNRKIILPALRLNNFLEKLNKDELYLLALELNLPDLINFCRSSKRINEKVCKNREIWIYRLKKDFNFQYRKRYALEPDKIYILLYKIREGLKINRYLLGDPLYRLYMHRGYLRHSLPNDKERRKMDYITNFLNDIIYDDIIYDEQTGYENEEYEDNIEEFWYKYRERITESYLPFHKKGITITSEDIDDFFDNAGEIITKIQEKSYYKLIEGIKKDWEINQLSYGNDDIIKISDKEIEAILSINELIKNNIFSISAEPEDYLNFIYFSGDF